MNELEKVKEELKQIIKVSKQKTELIKFLEKEKFELEKKIERIKNIIGDFDEE